MGSERDRRPDRPLLQAAVAWVVLVLAPDLASRGRALLDSGAVNVAGYLAIGAAVLLGWLALVAILARLRASARWLAWPILLGAALVTPVAVLLSVQYRMILGVELPPSAVLFFLRNTRYAWALVREATSAWHWVAVGGVALALALALARWTRRPIGLDPWLALPAIGLPLAVAAHVVWSSPIPVDLQGMVALGGGAVLRVFNQQKLPRSPQRVVPPAGASETPDVVVLIHESLGAYQWRPWSADPVRSPVLERLFADHADHALWFSNAVSAAGATDVSVPAILTGLAPDSPRADFARAPVLWQEARVLGYATALVSAQSFEEANFPRFFLRHDAPDLARTARDFPTASRTVDDGVDDALAVDEAQRWIDSVPADQPLLLVVQFNGTHAPCWVPGEAAGGKLAAAGEALQQRCAKAADYEAEQTARLLDHLQQRGRLDRALVLGTADHGADTIRPDRPPRVESYYQYSLQVPLFVLLPRSSLERHPQWSQNAQANRSARVGNVDIYPTVLDVWGRWPPAFERPPFAGQSLLRPIDPDRVMVVSNTNDIRAWSRDGFAVYRGPWKWIVDDREGLKAFRLDEDPDEAHDLWSTMPEADRAQFLREASQRPALRRILERVDKRLVETAR